MTLVRPIGVLVAGFLGATGVAAAAASSHAGAALLAPYSLVALTHAPALLALALSPVSSRALRFGMVVLMVGALLFCGDLAVRYILGTTPFRLLAPLGGTTMIVGWLAIGFAGILLALKDETEN